MILKLELSASSPVATSLEVSMPLHQPATFPFPSVSLANPSRWYIRFRLVSFVHGVTSLHYHEVADSNSNLCFVCMCNGKQGEDVFKVLCSIPMYNCAT